VQIAFLVECYRRARRQQVCPFYFEPEGYRRGWITIRPDLEHQLALRRLVALCRDIQFRLTVAISPLKAWNLDLNGPAGGGRLLRD
jgi:hypothetical protein